ncbi:glycosyl hydrolases family 38 N-terminal domain-containing protein [Auriculariales sp. MPI-PUGE-AT-0066]|nr:glycosyl hydrolases family 38 N-terminal domain-containing protein [Auriculariales sp. MPI-PUGE-AT-0066]
MSCTHNHGAAAGYPELNLGSNAAKWQKNLTQDRMGQFLDGKWTDYNLAGSLYIARVDDPDHVQLSVWSAPGRTKPLFAEAMKQNFKPAKKGDRYGPSWTNHWFKVCLKIPGDYTKYERVQFEWDPNCEAMIFTTDGTPLQGITGSNGGDRRVEYIIPHDVVKSGKHEFVIETSCNGMFGTGSEIQAPDMDRYFTLDLADIVVPNLEAWGLRWDFDTLRELVQTLPGNSILQNKALVAANDIQNAFDRGDKEGSIKRGRKIAERVFGEGWEKKGAKIYEEGDTPPTLFGIGHCHIDTAWLWPYHVTQQKTARSWSTQVDLMERYPEHRFTCSSAQQYKWLEKQYPKLFKRISDRVASGQFHTVGGSWVENDSNMPSGEALARQFIFGQRFFESRFGARCDTAWLPDSFGLTGALPQIIRQADMKYFFTQKLSWNNINVFPHSTFNWIGIDGTQVMCHMTPVDTYNAQVTVGDLRKGEQNHKNLESSNASLLVFGNGDGGGGPLARMLESLRRLRAVSNQSRDLPVPTIGNTVGDFFSKIETATDAGKKLPNWHGELYLEFHRGTYTSHGSIKKGNRKSEILLRDAEYLATLATLHDGKKYTYPKDKIDESWEKVLLNQFHDVLPGSAIGMVYDDAEILYAEVAKDGKHVIESAFDVLCPDSVPFAPGCALPAKATRIVAVNTTPFPRREVIAVPAVSQLRREAVQVSTAGDVAYVLVEDECGGGAVGVRGMFADIAPATACVTQNGDHVLQNSAVKLTISKGRITSLYDIALGRELIPEGESGGLIIFEDRPLYWDAWDVEIFHLEMPTKLEFAHIKIAANGPARASLTAQVKLSNSTIDVTISLDAVPASTQAKSRAFFRFDTKVDWHQRHEILKFELPVDIHSDNAYYESQWGHVSRPTHRNTTWDAAKFEVCGHKYSDLSEYGYGVALLSESKYGFSTDGHMMRMSLLRAATGPDSEQDQGVHEFSWAILPHEGHFLQSDVPAAAYLFNSPLHLRAVADTGLAHATSLAKTPFTISGAQNVIIETIKRGDDEEKDGAASIILRIYEAFGGHAKARLHVSSSIPVKKASLVNLLEDEIKPLELNDGVVELEFRGFQFHTVKLVLKDADSASSSSSPTSTEWVAV